MTFFRIKDWNVHFENNRTRDLKVMAWIPVPNKHDGDGYTALVDRENGSAILGAWLVILQVASKCDPRGSLLRDGKKPHTSHSIARITRLPAGIIQEALDICSKEVQWIEIVELTDNPQEGAVIPQEGAITPHPTDEEGKGMELKEEKGTCSVFSEEPSWSEFWEYCKSPHCGIAAEWFARDKFQAQDIKGWNEVRDWRKFALRVRGWWDNDGRPMTPPSRNGQASKKPIHHLRDMTYDARTPEQIAEQEARGLR